YTIFYRNWSSDVFTSDLNTTSKEKTKQKRQKTSRWWTFALIFDNHKLLHCQILSICVISYALKSRTFRRRENTSSTDWRHIEILKATFCFYHHRSLPVVIKKFNSSISPRNLNILFFQVYWHKSKCSCLTRSWT